MKKIYSTFLAVLAIGTITTISAQQQPNNGGFENWDNAGQSTAEPTGWNGMMTASLCAFCGGAQSQRVFQDASDYHGGSYSVRIESTSYLGQTVNGALTTGRVTALDITPSNGYNITLTGNSNFNHPFTDAPDSVVVWVKYNMTNASDSARVSVVLHDSYDVRDPQDGASASHIVATARKNFQTGGVWSRLSIPFTDGPSMNGSAYALMTFTANYLAGSGSSSAKLWVDDLEFIYNPADPTSVEELAEVVSVFPNPTNDGRVSIALGNDMKNGMVTVLNVMGQTVGQFSFVNDNRVDLQLDQPAGIYFLNIRTEDGQTSTVRVVKN